jgi:hypothetical protein
VEAGEELLSCSAARVVTRPGLPIRRPSPTIFAGLFASGGFMNAICRCSFQFALALAIPLFASGIPTPAFAYTPEQQQACTPDAMRLCGEYVPDVERITACMIARKSQLSPECRQFFRPGPEPGEIADAPADIKPVARKPVRAKPKKPKKPAPS